MKIEWERLIPTNAPLVGFRGTRVYPLGPVTLPVIVGDYPQQIIKDVTFLVVDYSSAYNNILGRLNDQVPNQVRSRRSTGKSYGDVRKCYIAMLEMDDHLQTMCIKEQWIVAEIVEGLEEIILDDARPEWTTRIEL